MLVDLISASNWTIHPKRKNLNVTVETRKGVGNIPISMYKPFKALVSYLGGKRKLVPEIFKHVPSSVDAPVFADGFVGGCSVSLFAKARGHIVLANDLSVRSFIPAKALIENNTILIEEEDILKLFVPVKTDDFILSTYTPKVFTRKIARFLDIAFENIKTMPEHKQWIMKLLLIKFIMSTKPFGHMTMGAKSIESLDQGQYEDGLKKRSYAKNNLRQVHNPAIFLRELASRINYAVCDNGNENRVYQGDVFDFVKNIKADVIYLDPPYADTVSYEESYVILDNILKGRKDKPVVSVFTKKDALEFIDKLCKASTHIKDWIISMGQPDPSRGISPEELLKVVRKYKPKAEYRILDHSWSVDNSNSKKKKDVVEYIIYTHYAK